MSRKLYRRFKVESKSSPYCRGQAVYNEWPMHALEINILINLRSQEQTLFCPPKSFNEMILRQFKDIGFMQSYSPGKHNKRRELVKRFNVYSFGHYAKQAIWGRFGSLPMDQPVFGFDDIRHGITLQFEGKYYSAEVRYGWAFFKTETHNVTMKLVENQWTFKDMATIESSENDLPF